MKLSTAKRELDEIIERLDSIKENECCDMQSQLVVYNRRQRDIQKDIFKSSQTDSIEKEAEIKTIDEQVLDIYKKINMLALKL